MEGLARQRVIHLILVILYLLTILVQEIFGSSGKCMHRRHWAQGCTPELLESRPLMGTHMDFVMGKHNPGSDSVMQRLSLTLALSLWEREWVISPAAVIGYRSLSGDKRYAPSG